MRELSRLFVPTTYLCYCHECDVFVDHHWESLFWDAYLPYVTLSGPFHMCLVRGQQAPLVDSQHRDLGWRD